MILRACIATAIAFALLSAPAGAQLTESEKQLLRGSISTDSARAAGKAGDATVLERIVELGDPGLVQSFGYGIQTTNVYVLPPQVEAVVIKHFDHPKVGAALRALPGRYASRALFDLHLARIKASYRSDEPSFEQIVRTEQAGVDEEILAVAGKFPSRNGQLSGAANFLGRRRHAGAIPLLLAAIGPGYEPPYNTSLYNTALDLLLAYPSEEVWRKAAAELERVKGEGKVRDDQYTHARRKLDPMLADPAAVLARLRSNDAWEQFMERRKALAPLADEANALYKTSPREYPAARSRYLEAEEALAREFRDERIDSHIAYSWGQLGIYVRFLLGDPRGAVRYLERGAKRELIAQVVLADTYQLALKDSAAALKAYERALDTATRQAAGVHRDTPPLAPGRVVTAFWKSWLAAEVEYLRTGKPFTGRVPEPVIVGFWDVVADHGRLASIFFPQWASPQHLPQMAYSARGAPRAPTWASVEYGLAHMDRETLGARLAQAPSSRFALLVTLRYISALPRQDAILKELARSDPSGYWTTIALGTVAFHESTAARRDEALATGVAEAMPGMAAKPNVLATAARQHMQSRALRTVETKP